MANNGLAHYTNSRAGSGLWEPLYLNQFRVTIIPPASITADRIVLTQELQKINGLEVEQIPTTAVIQNFFNTTRPFAGAKPEKTHLEMKLSFNVNLDDSNSMYTYNILRKWSDLVRDPNTGAMGIKRDYTDNGNTQVIVQAHTKKGQIYRIITGYHVFPGSSLNAMELDYTSEEIYKVEDFTLIASYFDDVRVGQ